MNSLGPLTALSSLTATAAARTTATASPSLTRLALALGGVRHASRKERDKPTPKPPKSTKLPPPGHGERIYIFNHIMANHIVYSFSPVMKVRRFFFFPLGVPPLLLRRNLPFSPLSLLCLSSTTQ